jgi:hypothetical protein
MEEILTVALDIKVLFWKNNANANDLNKFLKEKLKEIKRPEQFTLPLQPKIVLTDFIYEDCKVLTSKKLPLKLKFKNSDPLTDDKENFSIIYKVGDDLR